jgi:uncharacterized membrane protein
MAAPSPRRFLLLVVVLAFVIALVQIGLVSIAFDKLGLSRDAAYLMLVFTLGGSLINLPVLTLKSDAPPPPPPPEVERLLGRWPFSPLPPFDGRVTVTINLGGAVVPISFSLYLFLHVPMGMFEVVAAVAAVTAISSTFSRPIPGIGIGMPIFIAPLAAALIATLIDPAHRAPLAYIAGTLGVLIGADLMRLKDIAKLGSPFASIGGAGTLDGVFLTGIIAVLLA